MATAFFGSAQFRASLEPLWPGRDKERNRTVAPTETVLLLVRLELLLGQNAAFGH